ncbi:hypothetical protein SLEP1_g30272 [Rubroshorea leprosula]|uniref:Uncharacterized protein n=1 Tax=Rubroshorea leprosula TaxID=152421 RepID=A0AAV5K836_9ROSI|nr:hypothetical protein SLEP1_g30272 [Rubroshorea leprosula]
MREPRYPLPRVVFVSVEGGARPACAGAGLHVGFPWCGPHRGSLAGARVGGLDSRALTSTPGCRREGTGLLPDAFPPRTPPSLKRVRGSFCWAGIDNDPSASSPTETLLQLLLPLNDKVQWTSRDVAGGEPPPSPPSEHFTRPFNR